MNSPSTPAPRRHVWRWVFLGLGVCLAPFVLLAVVAFSFVSLDSDAAALRKQVMAATDGGWHTKVQVSVGSLSLAAIRTGLCFVHHENIADARTALSAIGSTSVGVYERNSDRANWSRAELLNDTDRTMQKRGWTRMVGVADGKDTVMIYVPKDLDDDGPVDICLAVVSGRELVVVSTSINPAQLSELVARHSAGDMKRHLHLAKVGF